MRTFLLFPFLMLAAALVSAGTTDSRWKTMPYPAKVSIHDGQFTVDSNFNVVLTGYTEPRLERAAERFLTTLSRETGIPLRASVSKDATAKLVVHTREASQPVQQVGEDESYTLEITAQQIKVDAANPLGAMHGLATLLQAVEPGNGGFVIPAATIKDQPRFSWRGLMIDVGRHFMPVEVIKRNLDGMAAMKMNVLHWHLSEDQGVRVESKTLPKLQELGSDGNCYTQEQIKDVIEYARDRGIRVVPEFDMPGHSTAWFVGYPELASGPGPYQIERKWGIFDPAMDPTKETTYETLDKFIGEMTALFPDKYFHVGGDEVNGKQWDANAAIQQFMKAHKLKKNDDLQAYFNKRVQQIVTRHGKTMVGWDEVLHPGLPKESVVQSWRGQESLAEAATRGYRGILSHGYYLDLMYPTFSHYSTDPLGYAAANLNDDQKRRVLGGESCMWSEYVTPENIDSRIWPRNAAIAERLWSPQNLTDIDSMYQRMKLTSAKLTYFGLDHETNYRPMLQRIAGAGDVQWLKSLVDYVEPVKEYTRGRSNTYTQFTSLNRIIDAARPESLPARDFSQAVDRVISGKARPEEKKLVQDQLAAWHDLEVPAAAAQAPLAKEAVPIAELFKTYAQIGLDALAKVAAKQPSDEQWRSQQMAVLEAGRKPVSEVLIMVIPAIEQLVKASGGAK